MVTAILKCKIRKTFAEWDQAFCSHQPIARPTGIFEMYHGHAPDDEKNCAIYVMPSAQELQTFMELKGAATGKSGHILESTFSEIYVN